MSNSIAPGSSADVNVRVTALTTNPNVPVTYKTIILKKNLVNGVNTLTQEMISTTNTKYVVKYDYVLGDNITVPTNCILEFDGGSFNGVHTLTGQNTLVYGEYCFKINIEGNFYKTNEDLITNTADLSLLGCTADEINATRNTNIINYAIQNYTILYFTQIYPINDSIDASYSGKSYIGKDRIKCGILMVSNNLPIFDFKLKNAEGAVTLHNIEVKSLQINYKTYQNSNQNSVVFNFSTESQTVYYYGWQQINFENLTINNPYGVVNATIEPLWDDYYTDIIVNNAAGYFFHTQSTAELQHIFKNIRILNYGHRTDSDHNAESCFYVRGGELHIDCLDLECWYGILIYSGSGQLSVKNSHFEHIVLNNSYAIFANGRFYFVSNHIVGRYIVGITGSLFKIYGEAPATILNNDISITNETTYQFRYLQGASGSSRARIFTDFPFNTTTTILPGGYGDELLTNPYCVYQGGVKAPIPSLNRPTVTQVGTEIFDSTLGKPIYWNGTAWVDATGTPV